jgi:hypothetical protein
MILALDFDRTLFNTDQDIVAMYDANVLHMIGDPAVNGIVDPAPFLFSDALPFLDSHSKAHLYIVTAVTERYGPRSAEYQRDKIVRSGVASRVSDIVLTGDSKVQALRDIASKHPDERIVFLDDRTDILLEVQAALPAVMVVHMSREGAKVMSDVPLPDSIRTVHSLKEFERIISQ